MTEREGDIEEAREILTDLVTNIETDGPYSAEATCTFIRQALLCLNATPADQEPVPIYQVYEQFEGGWYDSKKETYDRTDGAFKRIVYASPPIPQREIENIRDSAIEQCAMVCDAQGTKWFDRGEEDRGTAGFWLREELRTLKSAQQTLLTLLMCRAVRD